MLFLDGVYTRDDSGKFVFHYNQAPTAAQLTELLHTISQRIACFLERRGLLVRDEENSYLTLDGLDEDPMGDIHSHSVTYRIAMGPQRGRKVFNLQSIPPRLDLPSGSDRVAKTQLVTKREKTDKNPRNEPQSGLSRWVSFQCKWWVTFRCNLTCYACIASFNGLIPRIFMATENPLD